MKNLVLLSFSIAAAAVSTPAFAYNVELCGKVVQVAPDEVYVPGTAQAIDPFMGAVALKTSVPLDSTGKVNESSLGDFTVYPTRILMSGEDLKLKITRPAFGGGDPPPPLEVTAKREKS